MCSPEHTLTISCDHLCTPGVTKLEIVTSFVLFDTCTRGLVNDHEGVSTLDLQRLASSFALKAAEATSHQHEDIE